jgi:predicted dehydrogenase
MENILLIGTGPMAMDYVKVLNALSKNFTVIGRGESSAKIFKEKTGIQAITGGIDAYLKRNEINTSSYAIVATGTEALMPTLLKLKKAGLHKILIEKPAALSIDELLEQEEFLKDVGNSIFVAYNRRYYASVIEAKRLIEEDGGLQSMHFEFTEWAHKIEPLKKAEGVKENWFFANSTHVVDLAFYIAGVPMNWNCFSKSGDLTWHKKTNFVGAGVTEKEVLFSYLSNWESAGRWAIELLTNKRRIYLKPIEGIDIQLKGTIALEKHSFDSQIDTAFKPGLYKQVESFLNDDAKDMCSLIEHIENAKSIYSKILA